MPVQLPFSAVSCWPAFAVPLIVGLAVFLGGFPAAATTAVGAERAVADPSAFFAVTSTRIVWPASAPTSV